MITFTKEALARVTQAQITKLVELDTRLGGVRCSVDSSLPNGYIYVILGPYYTHDQDVHGGISPEGVLST